MTSQTPRLAKVLVVEDSLADQCLIRLALKSASWVEKTYIVGSAEEAFDFLENKEPYVAMPSPDLIICDLHLPNKDGQYVVSRIKSSRKYMAIPLVLFSTYADEENVSHAYSRGAEIYLKKPQEIDSLFRMMENLSDFWRKIREQSKRKRRLILKKRFRTLLSLRAPSVS